VILAPSVLHGDLLGPALSITGKGTTCVATAVAPMTQATASISLSDLTLWNKELKGTLYGSVNPRLAIPQLLARVRGRDSQARRADHPAVLP
jgi:Zn-dependent alcohol dehydrogenase